MHALRAIVEVLAEEDIMAVEVIISSVMVFGMIHVLNIAGIHLMFFITIVQVNGLRVVMEYIETLLVVCV